MEPRDGKQKSLCSPSFGYPVAIRWDWGKNSYLGEVFKRRIGGLAVGWEVNCW